MPQTAGRSIARSFRDYRRAADARPRRPDGAAACTLRCLREGQHAGDVDLDGPLSQQRYSVPVACAHHEVQVRGYVHEVVIGCGAEVIARHQRSYEKADMVFDPMHFLPLLEQKVGALDQAAPLQGWDLPGEFATLHRLLEARMGKKGQARIRPGSAAAGDFRDGPCSRAIRQSLELGAIGYDAVKHLVLCRIERRPPRLDLDIYPYLPKARVETTKPASYMSLMTQVPA